jgi:hypothetical protein
MKSTLLAIFATLVFFAIGNNNANKPKGCPVIIECGTQQCKVKCHRFNPDLQNDTTQIDLN